MRIGLITPGFSESEEDWCIPAVLDLVRVLAEHDDVTVFTLRYPHRLQPYVVYGARVFPTGGAERGGLARFPIVLRTLFRILRQAREQPFDVLLALWAHEPGFVASLAGRLTRTPVLVSILGGELVDLPEIEYGGERSPINRWLIARALAGADRVTVGSRWLHRLARCRVPANKLKVQPLGLDQSRFQSTSAEEEPIRFDGNLELLQVASLNPVKDQRTLLESFARVSPHYQGVRLHLVGEGELRPQIVRWVDELGLGDRVELHGAVDHGNLASYYRQADLLVQSSRFESQGMAVLEAASCGCPVVGTAVGVIPELCPADLMAEPGDVDALARLLESLLADSGRRRSLVRSQAEVARSFELHQVVGCWREQLSDLAGMAQEARRQ